MEMHGMIRAEICSGRCRAILLTPVKRNDVMQSEQQGPMISREIPFQTRPVTMHDPVDEDRDPVYTDEYVLYAKALREEELASRRRRASS